MKQIPLPQHINCDLINTLPSNAFRRINSATELNPHSRIYSQLKKQSSQDSKSSHLLSTTSTFISSCESHNEVPFTADVDIINFIKPHVLLISSINLCLLQEEMKSKCVYLLSVPVKPVLILDIDGTLVCNENGYIIFRPFLEQFLFNLRSKYELWLWTAGESKYLRYIMSLLDPEKHIFAKCLDVNYCTLVNGVPIKDIRIFQNLDCSKVVLMDDQLVSFMPTLDNGILVGEFKGGEDNELMKWGEVLMIAAEQDSIKKFLSQELHLRDCVNSII